MASVAVRQAVIADLDALAPLFDAYRQFYGGKSDEAGAKAFLRDRFEHGESVLFIAEAGGKAVGFTQLYPSFSSLSMRRAFVLNDLFVSPAARRTGTGALLLQAAAAYGRQVGAAHLSLATAVTNKTAQSLYEAQGWVRDREFYVYNLDMKA